MKDVDLQELLKLFKKTFISAGNVFHSRAQFFNIKQEDNETLDEYWKTLVDIERKFEFNRITPEEIITYKFAATINDKKARDNFIKGPLKLQMVLQTIEQDTTTANTETRNLQTKNTKDFPRTVRQAKNNSPIPIQHGNEKQPKRARRNHQTVTATFAVNRIGHWNILVQHGEHDAITARKWDTSP